jgi:hypothetical protein
MITVLDRPAHWLAPWPRLSSPCVVCGVHPASLHASVRPGCERDHFAADGPRCAVCAIRMPESTVATAFGACLRKPPQFDATIALGDYAPPQSGMVLALKSGGRLALADAFGALLAQHLGAERADVLVTAASIRPSKSHAAWPAMPGSTSPRTPCCGFAMPSPSICSHWMNATATCAARSPRAATCTTAMSGSSTT